MPGRSRGSAVAVTALLLAVAAPAGAGQTAQQSAEDLLAKIAVEPRFVPHYLNLAERLFADGKLDDAERVLLAAGNLVREQADQASQAAGRGRARGRGGGRGPLPANLPELEASAGRTRTFHPPTLRDPLRPELPAPGLDALSGALAVVVAEVQPDGTVGAARLEAASADALGAAALAAVRAARFEPTDADAALVTRIYVLVNPATRSAEVTVAPASRSLAGYMRAIRTLLDRDALARAIAALDAAADVIRRERSGRGTADYSSVPDAGAYQPAGTRGRAVRSGGLMPAYPPTAKDAGTSGVVGLEVVVDADGQVISVVVSSSAEGLDRAAVEAVRQWRFVPGHVDGLPVPQLVPVTMVFIAERDLVTDRPRVGAMVPEPGRIVDVEPVYPADARARDEQGTVILDVTIDRDGRIKDAAVLRSVSPDLDAAALAAVRQWRYEPSVIEGVPVEVAMTVTISFTIR